MKCSPRIFLSPNSQSPHLCQAFQASLRCHLIQARDSASRLEGSRAEDLVRVIAASKASGVTQAVRSWAAERSPWSQAFSPLFPTRAAFLPVRPPATATNSAFVSWLFLHTPSLPRLFAVYVVLGLKKYKPGCFATDDERGVYPLLSLASACLRPAMAVKQLSPGLRAGVACSCGRSVFNNYCCCGSRWSDVNMCFGCVGTGKHPALNSFASISSRHEKFSELMMSG